MTWFDEAKKIAAVELLTWPDWLKRTMADDDSRHGPGPNGEWGRWEQLPDRNQFGNLQHHYLCAVYRFVPFDADDPDPGAQP